VLFAFLAIVMVVTVPAVAQDEPTPVPEPSPAEPQAEPEEPPDEPEEPQPVAATEPPAEPAAGEAPAPAATPEPVADPVPAPPAAPKVYRQKTLVEVDGRSELKGVLELVVQPKGEDPVLVRVNILERTKAKKITEDLLQQIDFALDDRYKVKRTGDRKISIKIRKKTMAPLAVELKTQDLSGVAVRISNG
jgi:hypothetical protein